MGRINKKGNIIYLNNIRLNVYKYYKTIKIFWDKKYKNNKKVNQYIKNLKMKIQFQHKKIFK